MAPKGAKDNHATTHARSDNGHRPNRGQWAGMNNWRGHFATPTTKTKITHEKTVRRRERGPGNRHGRGTG
jgi:hypothetical protein